MMVRFLPFLRIQGPWFAEICVLVPGFAGVRATMGAVRVFAPYLDGAGL